MKKISYSFLCIVVFLLQGCIPVVFVAGATAGGVMVSDRRNLETIVEDKKINCRALLQLNSDPYFKEHSHISVTTFNRIVLLAGQVESPEMRRRAYELVKCVPNIRRINNQLCIGEPVHTMDKSMDVWITTKVKTAMLREKGLKSTQIKVLTEACTVYLMGLVTHEQAEIAVEVVREVNRVEKVVTLFEYID